MDKVQELVVIQAKKIAELNELIKKLERENNDLREVLREYQLAYVN